MVFTSVRVDTMTEALVCLAAGLGIGFVSIFVINALGAGYGKIAAWALGRQENHAPAEALSPVSN